MSGRLSQIAKVDIQDVLQERSKGSFPFCSLELQWSGSKPVQPLRKKVAIKGTKEKNVFFTIRYNPQDAGEYNVTILLLIM